MAQQAPRARGYGPQLAAFEDLFGWQMSEIGFGIALANIARSCIANPPIISSGVDPRSS
jgi:hypothetical protein